MRQQAKADTEVMVKSDNPQVRDFVSDNCFMIPDGIMPLNQDTHLYRNCLLLCIVSRNHSYFLALWIGNFPKGWRAFGDVLTSMEINKCIGHCIFKPTLGRFHNGEMSPTVNHIDIFDREFVGRTGFRSVMPMAFGVSWEKVNFVRFYSGKVTNIIKFSRNPSKLLEKAY